MKAWAHIAWIGLACWLGFAARVTGAAPSPLLLPRVGPDRIVPRGWPLQIETHRAESLTLQPLILTNSGGFSMILPPSPTRTWWLAPEQTQALPPGTLNILLGSISTSVSVADLPPPLSEEQREDKRLAEIQYALATGSPVQARLAAELWIAEEPDAPNAHAALGDALALLNEDEAALAAYNAALEHTVWTHPPRGLLQRARTLRSRLFSQYPTRVPEPEEPVFATLTAQDEYYLTDTNGQWAASAVASSEYRATDYSASRATGVPDVPSYGDHRNAWASKLADAGTEWIELTFPKAVYASGVRARQVYQPGAISRVELFDADGVGTTVYNAPDTTVYPPGKIAWFVTRFTRVPRLVNRVRLTLDSARVPGWNEIDAVQLVADPAPFGKTPIRILRAVHRPADESLTVTWASEVGAHYDVQASPGIGGPWTTVSGRYPATGSTEETTSYTEPLSTTDRRFYRIRLSQ